MEELEVFDINSVFAKVAEAMESAVEEHGEAAIELGLTAYRVFAAQEILIGIIFLIPLFFLPSIKRKVNKIEETESEQDKGFHTGMFYVIGGFTSIICIIVALQSITIVNVVAVFGYPEIMIVTKALQGTGLL